jgi:hypothetical protein
MYCTNCGTERLASATVCANCSQPVVQYPAPASVPNYLVHSILATLCCCLPFGIVAVVYAAQVNTKLATGDLAGAQASSRSARTWVIVSVVAGVFAGLVSVALNLINN